jgi:hypothetical protein
MAELAFFLSVSFSMALVGNEETPERGLSRNQGIGMAPLFWAFEGLEREMMI